MMDSLVEITKIALSSVMILMLIFLGSIMSVPLKYASASSQWTGTATIHSWFNDTHRPNIFQPLDENITFDFTVAQNNIITGSGNDLVTADVPGYCTPPPEHPFLVKGNFQQNNTVFIISFNNFSITRHLCPLLDNPNDHYITELSLPNDVIDIRAQDGGTFSAIPPTLEGHGQQNITLTIHENSNPTPEFGPVAPAVLLISILSIIILSVKTRFLH
jgi:hypothetical protein